MMRFNLIWPLATLIIVVSGVAYYLKQPSDIVLPDGLTLVSSERQPVSLSLIHI